MSLTLLSWNVNGIRAAARKGFLEWLGEASPDVLCVQETKAWPEQLEDAVRTPQGYHSFWDWGERKGYSGVAIFSKAEPVSVRRGFGVEQFDGEGRTLVAEFPDFTLCNVYFPNGQGSAERLAYKLAFYEAFLEFMLSVRDQGRDLIVCGDVNTAHHAIDLARPKENAKTSGFLPEERAWLDKLVAHGFFDTFRHFTDEPGHYSYWDMKSRARDRNVGWRIDYFFASSGLMSQVTDAFIRPDVMGSDHCPVGITLDLPKS